MLRIVKLIGILIAASLFFNAPAVCAAEKKKVKSSEQEMRDKMEMMDKMEMADHLDAAQSCARNNDFSCASDRLGKARKLASDNADRSRIASAESFVQGRRSRYDAEVRVAEENRAREQQRAAAEAQKKAKIARREELMKKGFEAYDGKDYTKAFSLFNEAAKEGVPKAYRLLGICYGYGIGTGRNLELSGHNFKKARELGDVSKEVDKAIAGVVAFVKEKEQNKAQASSGGGYSSGGSSSNNYSSGSNYSSSSGSSTPPNYSDYSKVQKSFDQTIRYEQRRK